MAQAQYDRLPAPVRGDHVGPEIIALRGGEDSVPQQLCGDADVLGVDVCNSGRHNVPEEMRVDGHTERLACALDDAS